jgi:hypothetical protein
MGHVVLSGASGPQNDEALFCMLGWGRYGFHKKRARKRKVKLVFLHLVGFAGHVLHSDAFGLQNVDALFVMLGCDHYGFNKKEARTRYAELVFLHPVGSAGDIVHSGAVSMKSVAGHIMPNLCFAVTESHVDI